MAVSSNQIMKSQELFVGEEGRSDPTHIVLRDWITSGVPTDLIPRDAQFPATFDRSVWPREEDLTEGPVRNQTSGRNILELTPLRPCRPAAGQSASRWRLCMSLVSSRGYLARSVREACEVKAIEHTTQRPSGWAGLGYDVLDAGLAMSALLNCGEAGQVAAWDVLRRNRAVLTKYYLWPTIAIAEHYAEVMKQIVPRHAPFDVVGLYICTG